MRAARWAVAFLATVVALTLVSSARQARNTQADVALQAAIKIETMDGNLKGAIDAYAKVVAQYSTNRPVAAEALVRMAGCYEKLGVAQTEEARKTYERLVRDFGDQKDLVAQAQARLAALGGVNFSGEVSMRRLEEFPALAVSRDGRYLAYADSASGELGLRDVSSGEHRLITHDSALRTNGWVDENAAFSPDGRQIAYNWEPADSHVELRVASTDGAGQPRVLYRCNWDAQILYVMPSAWTPDGKSILSLLLANSGGKFATKLVMIAVSDGKVSELKSFDGRWSIGNARVSPDGAYLMYAGLPLATSEQRAIMIVSTADLRETILVDSPATDAVWTSDGKAVVFLSRRRGTNDLWLQRVDRGQPQGSPELLRSEVGNALLLGLSPAGVLAYDLVSNMNYAYTAPFDPGTGRAGQAARLSDGVIGPGTPVWSPDGKTVAMIRRTPPRLVLRAVATGAEREIPLDLVGPTLWGWFPDGKSALVSGGAQAQAKGETFVRFYVDPPRAEPLPRLGSYLGQVRPTLSADGKTIFFAGLDSDRKGVAINALDLSSGTKREVLRTQFLTCLALSPDGRQFAYVERAAASAPHILYAADVNGGQPRKIVQFPASSTTWSALAWLPDGRHLLVAVNPGTTGAPWEIHRISVDDGASQAIGITAESMFNGLSVSSDGRQLAFASGVTAREAWVMENFLPKLVPGEILGLGHIDP